MSRQIRYVPFRWKHPHKIAKRLNGEKIEYRPMYQRDFDEEYADWQKELAEWYKGHKLWHTEGKYKCYDGEIITVTECVKKAVDRWEKDKVLPYHQLEKALLDMGEVNYEWYAGTSPAPPSPDDYMPRGKWIQLYEEVSKGTPLSPPFKTKEQLIDWLVNNKDFWGHQWTREQAEAMVKDEWSPSMVVSNGKVYTAEESTLLKGDN